MRTNDKCTVFTLYIHDVHNIQFTFFDYIVHRFVYVSISACVSFHSPSTHIYYLAATANADWSRKLIAPPTSLISGVARICIWRGLGARPARPEAPKAPEIVLGMGPGGGSPPPERGFGGITPEKILEI
jgi:hypothetical protein